MFKVYFRDYGNTNMKYCYIHNYHSDSIVNKLHIVTLCMHFSQSNNKLLGVSIIEDGLKLYPELRKAIQEVLFPLLEDQHRNNVENIINTFMVIYHV